MYTPDDRILLSFTDTTQPATYRVRVKLSRGRQPEKIPFHPSRCIRVVYLSTLAAEQKHACNYQSEGPSIFPDFPISVVF